MHISEGIITGTTALAYTAVSVGLVAIGAKKMKDFARENPEKKNLLGMAGAFIFFLSLIPIPAFTGTCSHPCGSPLIGILLGPFIGIAITGLTLLLQAAFFAHGGFSTWGANVITLGVGGAFFGWLAFRISRRIGLSLVVSAAIGGLIGDLMTYVIAGLSLGAVISGGPTPQFSFTGYLFAIYAAYIPTQLPIAVGEMFLTGYIVHYIYRQRAEILESLKVISAVVAILFALISVSVISPVSIYAHETENKAAVKQVSKNNKLLMESKNENTGMAGMDEAVNEKFAEKAGKSPRDPYINFESMGDVWNALLLLAGGICGFIIGRGWNSLFKKKSDPGSHAILKKEN